MVTVALCTFHELELEANFANLTKEYAEESHISGMPPITARFSMYREFDRKGSLMVYSAKVDGFLIGFMIIIFPVLPHYSLRTAIAESFFVAKEYRSTRAGLSLLAAGEKAAQIAGSPGFLCSASVDSPLAQLLPLRGYTETNQVFFKKLEQPQAPVVKTTPALPAMTEKEISRAAQVEEILKQCPQAIVPTLQTIHGGVYTRTVKVSAGNVIAGVFIKIPTTLVVVGASKIFIGDEVIEVSGYNVLPASKGRKQVFLALTDIYITMAFPTQAKTVEEAEAEFTDETDQLLSRRDAANNHVIVTGE